MVSVVSRNTNADAAMKIRIALTTDVADRPPLLLGDVGAGTARAERYDDDMMFVLLLFFVAIDTLR